MHTGANFLNICWKFVPMRHIFKWKFLIFGIFGNRGEFRRLCLTMRLIFHSVSKIDFRVIFKKLVPESSPGASIPLK